ncbi:MAG: GIDE domain-containing protein [Gammaproteobacteria bacterium]|nr:GIDE domain-containing protein [Gammaproteobacteria bacterium]
MLESLKQEIIAADTVGIIILLIILAAICAASLYGIFRFFHRSRIIDDTPTSKIRSAHQGFVELEGEGRLMKGTPIISPLSKKQCLWYSYKIEHKVREHDFGTNKMDALTKSDWETVNSGVSDNLFLLADDTGICVIDPEGAVITPSFSKTWYGSQDYNVTDTASAKAVLSLSRLSGNNDYRYTEKRIDVGEELYLLGRFKTIGGRREKLDKKGEVRDLLSSWKNKPDFLLAQFDENGDGEIDVDEWQKVMAKAEIEVEKSFGERLVQQEIHTLSKPIDSRRPFIISVESQESIANKYRWYSRGSIIGFFFGGISFVWVIGIRLVS